MRRRLTAFALVALLLAIACAFAGCTCKKDQPMVSLTGGSGSGDTTTTPRPERLRIAVAAMISPKDTFEYYQQILDYIAKKSGTEVELVQRETYEEVNDLVRSGDLDLAFVCTGAYVEGHDDWGMELLVAPVAYGASVYYSYVIVPKDSPAQSLADLRGKKYAFTDPLSNTGALVPTYMLGRMNETTSTFFASVAFTNSHDKSIEAVAEGVYDGASVDSLVWDYMNATDPESTSQTRIVEKSSPYGIPPVVVPPGMDLGLKTQLRDILLHMHEDPDGRAILERVRIDRFATIDDGAYDSVREMQAWLEADGQ